MHICKCILHAIQHYSMVHKTIFAFERLFLTLSFHIILPGIHLLHDGENNENVFPKVNIQHNNLHFLNDIYIELPVLY